MNIPKNPESVKLTLTQTAKGYWYIKDLSAYGSTVKDMLKQLDLLINETNNRLVKLNSNGGNN